uniref:Uncharacterized protein n=1 Tax=Solanum lycopersicum TaxID=4081 RepID=A0A3Q7IF95_SOLLC
MIKTKSVKSMPFYFSFFSFLCSISWTAYAIIRVEFYLLTANVIGTRKTNSDDFESLDQRR